MTLKNAIEWLSECTDAGRYTGAYDDFVEVLRPYMSVDELRTASTALGGVSALARALSTPDPTVRNWMRRGIPEHASRAIFALGNGCTFDVLAAQRAAAVEPTPPLQSPVPLGHRTRGVSSLMRADGSVAMQWIKTSAKERQSQIDLETIRQYFADVPPAPARARPPVVATDDLLSLLPLGDAHVGMLSWGVETGDDYDLKIAEELMVAANRDLILRGPRTKHARILDVGDYHHADNGEAHTTHGHHSLDVDGRSARVLRVGLRIMTTMIDTALEHHELVTVDVRRGNHNSHTAMMHSLALEAYYRNEPRVTIDKTVSHRSYFRFGKVLIGATHGDRAKPKDLAGIMAAERAEDWGASKHRYWHCGHVHHMRAIDELGVRIESHCTLAARDAWHAEQGYFAPREAKRIIYHREFGEVARVSVNVDAIKAGGAVIC